MGCEDLLNRIRMGDQDALDQLQTQYGPLVRYVIAPILQDPRDREECFSSVLLLVWKQIHRYDPAKGSLTTWLTVLARNTALNMARHHREEAVLAEDAASEGNPEEALLREEQRQSLKQALENLSLREQTIFYRKYYYLQSTTQIAAELGLTERGVEGRLYRTKKKLQRLLGGEFHD